MRSLFIRAVLGMLLALALGLGMNSMLMFRMSREAPGPVFDLYEQQLELIAVQAEKASSLEETAQLVDRLGHAMRMPVHLFPPGAPIPPDFARVAMQSGALIAAPPPPRPPPWGWWLAIQSALVLCGVGAVAWALTAPLLRDLNAVEAAVGAMRDDDLSVRVPAVGAPVQPLAAAINRLAGRVEALVGGQRELLQAVSHELRTPLARLRFHLEELADGPDAAALAGADEELGELDSLIGELLVWLKADVQDGPVVVAQVQPLAERSAARLVSSEGLVVDLRCADVVFSAAERDLERVLDNLIGNAARYARSRIVVHAAVSRDRLVLDVSDDGVGFPDDAARLVEPFATADEARRSGGNGLGLSIVNRIALRYGGSVELGADPELGGARVRVCLAGGSA